MAFDLPLAKAHLRIARPTDQLPEILKFYCEGLGFQVLGWFQDHGGFDGVMLGHPDAPYHLEITQQRGQVAGPPPTKENLLVFYLPDPDVWQKSVARIEQAGFEAVRSHNPYWDRRGKTFEDADGYRIVLQQAEWPPPRRA
jgi:catechol 2,3-dioxygenase-like lactoylglutathione lyase family enzyme